LGITGGLKEEVDSPIYATGVGLVMHALRSGTTNNQTMLPPSSKGNNVEQVMQKITDRMKSWFKEL
jgi:cell division protein FtsA